MKIILVLTTVVLGSWGCKELIGERIVWDRYWDRTVAELVNGTIICSNIYSIGDIYYKYSTKEYDQFLKITDSNISTLNDGDFRKFNTIKKLFLSGIHLKEIRRDAFSDLRELEELYLDNNELTVVPHVFHHQKKLKILDLSGNKIGRIAKSSLSGLPVLWYLDLQSNQLLSLDEDVFQGLDKLSHLNLSGNPLEAVPSLGVPKLQYLGLSDTSVKTVTRGVTVVSLDLSKTKLRVVDFSTLPNATTFNFSSNAVTSLQNTQSLNSTTLILRDNNLNFFNESLKDLFMLDLGNNSLEVVDRTPFQHSPSIEVVDLSFNRISFIADDTFTNLSQLQYLHLQHNKISTVGVLLFKNLESLHDLDLSHNNIEGFQFGTFTTVPHLSLLDLSFNKLKKLDPKHFYSINYLRELDLSYNNMSNFDLKSARAYISNLNQVSLDGNNWKCNDLIEYKKQSYRLNIKSGRSFNVSNFLGVACENDEPRKANFTLGEFLNKVDQSIDEAIEKSKLRKFLNEGFEQTNFSKFFQEKNEIVEEKNEEESDLMAIVTIVLQLVMCVVLVAMAVLVYRYVSGNRNRKRPLTEDY